MNVVHDLKTNGRNIPVTEETKREYVKLVCIEKMTNSIKAQIDSFLEGFYEIIPKQLISIFDEQELELLIAGLPTIDIEDLKLNTEYHKYTEGSLQVSLTMVIDTSHIKSSIFYRYYIFFPRLSSDFHPSTEGYI